MKIRLPCLRANGHRCAMPVPPRFGWGVYGQKSYLRHGFEPMACIDYMCAQVGRVTRVRLNLRSNVIGSFATQGYDGVSLLCPRGSRHTKVSLIGLPLPSLIPNGLQFSVVV